MKNKTRAERKRDRLQGIGFFAILVGCVIASGLMDAFGPAVTAVVLGGMVLTGGVLVLWANK